MNNIFKKIHLLLNGFYRNQTEKKNDFWKKIL